MKEKNKIGDICINLTNYGLTEFQDIIGNQPSTESSKAQILDCIRDCQNALGKKFETRQLSGIDSEDEMANSR